MRERDYLYLKGTEELGEVLEVVRDYAGQEVILVVPVGMRALAHPVNLELLKRETDRLKKKILFSTEDDSIRDVVKAAGFNVFLEEYEDPNVVQKMVTDIVAPRSKTKTRRTAAPVDDDEPTPRRRVRLSWGWLRPLSYLLLVALIVGGIALGVSQFTSRATVTITLAEAGQEFHELVEIRPRLSSDSTANVLLGEEVKITKTHTLFALATGSGKEGGRAKGFITVTNEVSQSLPLVQGTRFQSPSGKIYRTTGRVTIPSSGKIRIEVIAEEPGDQYNVAAKISFTIPGLKGTAWESDLQAMTEEAISGGTSSAVKVVTVDDLAQGRTKLEQELKDLIMKELALRYPSYLLPEELGGADVEITDISHKVGQPAERIVFAGRGEIKTIGVRKDRLVEYLKDRIAKVQLQQQANVRITELAITNLKTVDLDPKLNFLRVEVSGTVKVKGDVDRAAVQEQLVGKTLEQVQQVLKQNPNIENAEASVWPFWAKTLPGQSTRIELRIR